MLFHKEYRRVELIWNTSLKDCFANMIIIKQTGSNVMTNLEIWDIQEDYIFVLNAEKVYGLMEDMIK